MRIIRLLISPYSSMLADKQMTPSDSSRCRNSCRGWPILMPKALASSDRAMAQPSFALSTTNGRPAYDGLKTLSQDA